MGCGASSPALAVTAEGKGEGEEKNTEEDGRDINNNQNVELEDDEGEIAPLPHKRHSDVSENGQGKHPSFGSNGVDSVMSSYSTLSSSGSPKPDEITKASLFAKLQHEYARFLINFAAMLGSARDSPEATDVIDAFSALPPKKPKLEIRAFKSHTLDNIKVRKLCDEFLRLEDPNHACHCSSEESWLPTLQTAQGKYIHGIRMNINPEVSIGGFFMIAQMLSYIKALIVLDLSNTQIKASEARVLAIGLSQNNSIQELRMKNNQLTSVGATSMSEVLRANTTLLLMDLRSNGIRGTGICALADAMDENKTLTELDLRWNYSGERSDYVVDALLDLKKCCLRNLRHSMDKFLKPFEKLSEDPEPNADTDAIVEQEAPPSLFTRTTSFAPALCKFRLEVTIRGARNLPQVIWNAGTAGEVPGMPQGYCVLQVNRQTIRTEVMKKSWNPVWNCMFGAAIKNVWQVCVIRVMHSKTVDAKHADDMSIGTLCVSVGEILNWKGVSKNLLDDGHCMWQAYHRPSNALKGCIYTICRGLNKNGDEVDLFETAEEAARAYDLVAAKKDGDKAGLNFEGAEKSIGQHVLDSDFLLAGDDGLSVIGVQAGVMSTISVCFKLYDLSLSYLEIHLDSANFLPKMDAGLGTCDAYCVLLIGDIHKFKSKVVRNSLDPSFDQMFRITVPADLDVLPMEIQVWDWDRFDDDDHIGSAFCDITPLIRKTDDPPETKTSIVTAAMLMKQSTKLALTPNPSSLSDSEPPNEASKIPSMRSKGKRLSPPPHLSDLEPKSSLDGAYSLRTPDGNDFVKNGKEQITKVNIRFVYTPSSELNEEE